VLLKKKEVVGAIAVAAVFLGVSLAGWALIGDAAWFVALSAVLVVLLLSQADIFRRVQHSIKRELQEFWRPEYRQLESLFSLFSVMNLHDPLPPMRAWAVSPDFANVIVSLIREVRPRTIVEAGTGVSTLIAGYCLRAQGEGQCLSLEHDETYASISSRNVEKHGLERHVNVAHARLVEVEVRGQRWLWYSPAVLEGITSVDMVIVDGPPGYVQDLARYPALPLLFDRLTDKAVVVIDDCNRQEEKAIVERWLKEYPFFSLETLDTERGAVVLRRYEPGLERRGSEALAASLRSG